MARLDEFRRIKDLLDSSEMDEPSEDQPYIFKAIFPRVGFRARAHAKKKFKLLKALDPVLSRVLLEDEKVFFVSSGVQCSLFDAYFLGLLMYYLNKTAILLTSHRILLIRIDGSRRPRDLFRQVRYDAIEKISSRLLGATMVRTRNGKTTTFDRVPRRDRKFMQSTLARLKSAYGLQGGPVDGVENLCPHCFAVVAGRPAGCPYCGATFKSANQATLLSLLFPGLGDWYLGHGLIAALEIVAACVVWLGVLASVLDDEPFVNDYGDVYEPLTVGESAVVVGAVFLVMHGIDALVTRRVAKTGIYLHRRPDSDSSGA